MKLYILKTPWLVFMGAFSTLELADEAYRFRYEEQREEYPSMATINHAKWIKDDMRNWSLRFPGVKSGRLACIEEISLDVIIGGDPAVYDYKGMERCANAT